MICESAVAGTVCPSCERTLQVGDFPFCPHGRPMPKYHTPFVPYFDEGLGMEISSHRQRAKELKKRNADVTDGMSKGDFNARRDRIEQRKREMR